MQIYFLLFPDYETLDLMGPVQLLSKLPQAGLHYVSQQGGLVVSRQGFAVVTEAVPSPLAADSVLLVPGGQGTRRLVHDRAFLRDLAVWAAQAQFCLSVCTGAALLAAAGCLDGVRATSNKRAFAWVQSTGPHTHWQAVARWVRDGRFYTASGVSAGMDMALGFIADHYGRKQAKDIAEQAEYLWQDDPCADGFAARYGLGGTASS